MSDKESKLRTRPPTASFLADTKPPVLVRNKTLKARSWHRTDDELEDAPEVVQKSTPPSLPDVKVVERSPVSGSPSRIPPDEPPRSKAPEPPTVATSPRVAVAPKVRSETQVNRAPPAGKDQWRQGASTAIVENSPAIESGEKTNADEGPFRAHNLSDRASSLISRAQSSCPHEYLFRQILMFEMSSIDTTGEFGLLSLSRNGLEQLFGISEGGVKKAKKEMEAYNLIVTVSVGTRKSPTVFKVFSPWTSSKRV